MNDKNIKVVMLGYGKTSKALFKSLVLNNQFVEIKGNKYQPKKVDYYLYDINNKSFQDPLLDILENKNGFISKRSEDIELPCNIHKSVIDVKNEHDESYLNLFKPKENEFTFYFISLKDGFENALIADKLNNLVSNSQSIIFYNVDTDKEALISSSNNIIPFGYKKSVLNHSYICDERLWELSNAHNKAYNEYKGNTEISYQRRPIIEKLSNTYSVINYRFKLNVLGFDFSKDSSSSISEEEFYQVYDKDNRRKEDKYENYFLISTRNAIAYQEHLRWVTFYIVNGYSMLPLEEVRYENNKLIHKNPLKKQHACLLPYYELDKLVKLEEKLLPEGIDKTSADVYRYDFQSLDKLFEVIKEAGLVVKKIN